MSTETNKAIVRRYIGQVFNEKRHDLVEEFLAENIELYGTGLVPGLEAVKQWLHMFTAAFPDMHYTIEDMVAEGNRVAARTTFNGTHKGEMQGIPATGKVVSVSSVTIFRLDNGRISEAWVASDNLEMMQQLGVIPMLQEN
jgi:steroid delta-isomerase-like uncharacterized protein